MSENKNHMNEALEAFKSKVINRIIFCKNGTRDKCVSLRKHKGLGPCTDLHFKKIIMSHTDESLGNCSYLDTCRHMEYCKFIHYKIDEQDELESKNNALKNAKPDAAAPIQWINCDLRHIDFRVIGNDCGVIMLDPPWDIHMTVGPVQLASLRHPQR